MVPNLLWVCIIIISIAPRYKMNRAFPTMTIRFKNVAVD
jgi:hypothetical protein